MIHDTPDAQPPDIETQLLAELLDLRRAVGSALGRQQYVYEVIERAIHSGHVPTMQRALEEFAQQPADVIEPVRDLRQAAGRPEANSV